MCTRYSACAGLHVPRSCRRWEFSKSRHTMALPFCALIACMPIPNIRFFNYANPWRPAARASPHIQRRCAGLDQRVSFAQSQKRQQSDCQTQKALIQRVSRTVPGRDFRQPIIPSVIIIVCYLRVPAGVSIRKGLPPVLAFEDVI